MSQLALLLQGAAPAAPVVADSLTPMASGAPSAVQNNAVAALLTVALAVAKYLEHRKQRRAPAHDTALRRRVEQLEEKLDAFAERTDRALLELRHRLIGVDGSNGMRGDLDHVKRVQGELLDRERQRLEQEALHGKYDRRVT
jgi:hypothetical protein